MNTKSYDPHTPMDPRYILSFLSETVLSDSSVKCMIKALKKYNKRCTEASKVLNKELKHCLKPDVRIRHSKDKK